MDILRPGKAYCKKAAKVGVLGLALLGGVVLSMNQKPIVHHVSKTGSLLGRKFRVMSVNIARGEGDTLYVKDLLMPPGKPTAGIDALEDIVREEKIDIMCSQEIEAAYTHGQDQPARIAGRTHLVNYTFGQNFAYHLPFMPSKWFADGNSIHARTKLDTPRKIPFDADNPSFLVRAAKPFAGIKGILHDRTYYSDGKGVYPVNIICTHLSAIKVDHNERDYEMKRLFDYAAQNTPAIVMGDFNTVPLGVQFIYNGQGGTYEGELGWYLAKATESIYGVKIQYDPGLHLFEPEMHPILPATYFGPVPPGQMGKPAEPDWTVPQKIIDYVLIVTHPDDPIKLRLKDTEVYYRRRCSDHVPVIADIEVVE